MKVKVSKETAKLLKDGKLVDSVTGEYHKSISYPSGTKLRMVTSSYVRVAKGVGKLQESGWAVGFLTDYPDGIVPKGLGRTDRWRLAKLISNGHACKLPDGRTLIDPNRWSCKGCPVNLLPERFK